MSETNKSIWTRQFPSVMPAIRWLFKPRMLRRYLFVLACLITAVALFYAEEDWRGKHAWLSYSRQSKLRGIDLDWHAHIPPPVPDEQNFGMLPFFKALFDYKWGPDGKLQWPDTNWVKREGVFSIDLSYGNNPGYGSWEQGRPVPLKEWQDYFRGTNFSPKYQPEGRSKRFTTVVSTRKWDITPLPQTPAADILLALTKFDPQLDELRKGSLRPYSQFPLHYEELPETLLAHLNVLAEACHVLQLRALAELELGKSEQALADMRLAFYCADATKTEPFPISQLVRSRTITENLQPIWEGLRLHQWPAQSLVALQQMLSKIDLLADFERVSKAGVAFTAGWIGIIPDEPQLFFASRGTYQFPQQILGWLPRGWYYQNEVSAARFFEETMLQDVAPEPQRVYPNRSLTNAIQFNTLPNTLRTFVFRQVGSVISPQSLAQAQTGVNLARIACGLERWRMAHGSYPKTLEELVPDFLDKSPHDIINGEPLKYRLKKDGQFLLYSVGWNEKDDGGIYPKTGATQPPDSSGENYYKVYRSETGDWVWQYPEGN